MPRVKRAVMHVKKRRTLHKLTKGYKWGRKSLIRSAKTAVKKAGQHAYEGRKDKKNDFRRLWQTKLSAALKPFELSYSKFIGLLKKNEILLDRKVLAELAEKKPKVFAKIVEKAKQ